MLKRMSVISKKGFSTAALVWGLTLALLVASATVTQPASQKSAQLRAIETYISQSWHTLTRSNKDLARAATDPKFPLGPEQRLPIYVAAANEDVQRVESSLRAQMSATDFARIELRRWPSNLTEIKQAGLLYLPYPYVVPGGRFNEMYGWDSYFIQLGLLQAGEIELARNMADNFVYEIENYGKILNANRTYYLTRSQPPFLTQMILGVYRQTNDKRWLRRTLPAIEIYYRYWTTGPHLVTQTGLSRYYDSGAGLMWDAKDGLYYDYNFKTNSVRRYPFVTTFYPLWAGIASAPQAERVMENLSLFERPGGLQTSTTRSGSQWDAPFGWAPMQIIAVAGLRRYGYHAPANRISVKFLSLILKEFNQHNVIVEKYDVERRDSQVRSGLKFGYTSNEIGFGWTNAAFLKLYADLPRQQRISLGRD